jgi:small GTP-binding protein
MVSPIKIILLGNTGVGKSALFHAYADNTFQPEYMATIGVDFRTKVVGDRRLQIWDTAGQERYSVLTSNYFRGADFVLLVYDITNHDSFRSLPEWVETVRHFVGNSVIRWIVVGNKADCCEHRKVSQEEAEAFAATLGAAMWEVSAKMGLRVDEVFESLVNQLPTIATSTSVVSLLQNRSTKPYSSRFFACFY